MKEKEENAIEPTYTTEEILDELGISESMFHEQLLKRGIIESITNGDITLSFEYIDWAEFQYFEGMEHQHLVWTKKGRESILKIIGKHGSKTYQIEVQHSTDEILKALGIPQMLFQKRLVNHRIAKYSTGNIVLRNKYKEWGHLEQIKGTNRYRFMWSEEGFEGILKVFDSDKLIDFSLENYYRTIQKSYSYLDIANELEISVFQLRKYLVMKDILLPMPGKATKAINPKYHEWVILSSKEPTKQDQFKWTNIGRDNIIRLYHSDTAKESSNKGKKATPTYQQSYDSILIDTENSSFFSTENIAKKLELTARQLREFLVAKKVVRSMKGKIGVFSDYADWGCFMTYGREQQRCFVWTRKGKEHIIELYRSNGTSPSIETTKKVQSFSSLPINTSQLQRTFKAKYADYLLEQAKLGLSLPNYALDTFPIEQENILYIPSIIHPNGLLDKMNPAIEKDFESAVALYEAYPCLSPLQASDKSFWVYLAHTELFPYVRERYPDVCNKNFDNSQYVLDYWFFGKGALNHALAGLWWAVYFSADEENPESKYDCTKFIFSKDSNFRTKYFVNNQIFRHKDASIGILRFLMEDEELCSAFFRQKVRYIIKYFNKLGGTRQLVSLDKEFFYQELKKIRPLIMAIQSDEDVKNSI